MDKKKKISKIREKLRNEVASVGSWMQLPNTSIAEILGKSGYDWVAVDMEHGSFANHQLPDLFRALELGDTLPMARLISADEQSCKQALDAGAGGLIAPKIETAMQAKAFKVFSAWPPSGERGVAFSRANLFGATFDDYAGFAQNPLLVGMIETAKGVENIEEILRANCLDAIFIGPYDLSASLGVIADFQHNMFLDALRKVKAAANKYQVALGMHVVDPDVSLVKQCISEGYTFIARSMDSVFMRQSAKYE